jgi:hypothetical protein
MQRRGNENLMINRKLQGAYGKKTNLYNKLAHCLHDDRQTEFDQILDYAYTEHSGEYSMMYSLNKSRFHKSVDTLTY